MDEFEVECDENGDPWSVSRRLIPADFAVLGLGLARDIASAVENTLGMAQALVAGHANFLTNQRLFRQEAAIEIETLTSGDDDG
jgi:hypothetical protein